MRAKNSDSHSPKTYLDRCGFSLALLLKYTLVFDWYCPLAKLLKISLLTGTSPVCFPCASVAGCRQTTAEYQEGS